jgi:hypothetical protein
MIKKETSAANQVMGMALVGVLSLVVVGQRFRVDMVGDRCDTLPSMAVQIAYSLVYVVGLGLLSAAWLRTRTLKLPLGQVLGLGLLVHAVALLTPPFLSLDSLCYAAIGRAMAVYHQSPYQPLVQSLPAGDRFLSVLPVVWQTDTSAYGPAFNELSRLVAQAGGDHMLDHLRLYQLVGMACMAGAAALVGLSFGEGRSHAGARAAALVLFCPVTVIEGTMNAHNDVMLALAVAAFVLLIRRQQSGMLPLIVGLTIKASGALILGVHGAQSVLSRARRRVGLGGLMMFGAVGFAMLLGGLVAFGKPGSMLYQFARLLGQPHEAVPHFTRSVESLPRAFLHYVLGMPTASWALGLVFRWLAGLWLLYAGMRGARDHKTLQWAATGLFGYYLFFHGYMQSWYLLSLVPLLPFASERLRPAMYCFCVSALGYYAVALPMTCVNAPALFVMRETFEAAILILPPAIMLLRSRPTPPALD